MFALARTALANGGSLAQLRVGGPSAVAGCLQGSRRLRSADTNSNAGSDRTGKVEGTPSSTASSAAVAKADLPERPPGSPESALDRIVWEIANLSEPTWKSSSAPVDPSKSFHDPKLDIDTSLHGHYQFGITPGELDGRADWVKRAFSFQNANQPEINRLRIHQAIQQFQQRPGDTGSTEVQVAVLTSKISYLTEHVKRNRNDLHSRRGLEIMVAQRRRLLKYLRAESAQRYGVLVRKLGIRSI